jgi:hypothetical protein
MSAIAATNNDSASPGPQTTYYIFMTATLSCGHGTQKNFPLNNFRTTYSTSHAMHSVASRMLGLTAIDLVSRRDTRHS